MATDSGIHSSRGAIYKRCSKCGLSKPRTEFYQEKKARDGLHAWCKKCSADYDTSPARRKYGREWKRKQARLDPTFYKKRHIRRYGLTWNQYNEMLETQQGRCAVCLGLPNGKGNSFHVDHDHKTHKVRGLLCHSCNTVLGHVRENPDHLKALIKYLESQ